MEPQHSFSPGLLYSVAPENFSQLHLQEEARGDEFERNEGVPQFEDDSFSQSILSFLRVTAAKWGVAKL